MLWLDLLGLIMTLVKGFKFMFVFRSIDFWSLLSDQVCPFVGNEYWINLGDVENIVTFMNLLAETNSAIVGSMALKIMLNGCGSNWAPQDLNVTVPCGSLCLLSDFMQGLQYRLNGTGICSRYTNGAFTHSIYVNPASNAVTIMEALSTDSFFSVVIGCGHTGLMNFISSEHVGCLYPTQTLKEHVAYPYQLVLHGHQGT